MKHTVELCNSVISHILRALLLALMNELTKLKTIDTDRKVVAEFAICDG